MGANLIGDGATFRVWAPRATHVYVALGGADEYQPRPQDELLKNPATGHWTGFFPGVADGTHYRFFVVGPAAGPGFKRDPWARELELYDHPGLRLHRARPGLLPVARRRLPAAGVQRPRRLPVPRRPCSSRATTPGTTSGGAGSRSSWTRSTGSSTWPTSGSTRCSRCRVVEFAGEWSLGYNGTDFFSPEMDYVRRPRPTWRRTWSASTTCSPKQGGRAADAAGTSTGQVNQLKAFIDVCHAYGLAVLVDVVYNHAGGGFDARASTTSTSPRHPDGHNSLYFSGEEWAGGRVFDVRPARRARVPDR